jgi:acyl-CoA dehydrogenase
MSQVANAGTEALGPAERDLQERARRFAEEELIPLEEQTERSGGRLGDDVRRRVAEAAIEARLHGGRHRPEHGGQGWSAVEAMLVKEQLGRATNGLYSLVPNAYNVLARGSEAQVRRHLVPALRGEARAAYAVTEEHAGSDPSRIAALAVPHGDGYRLDGEKWFVTYGDTADAFVVLAKVADGERRLPTLLLVERDRPGVEIVDDPPFTHVYPHGHPTVRFSGVELGADAVLGGVGEGDTLQRGWFVEERMWIAARALGAMWRLLEEALTWATGREQGGARLWDHQGVAFPLADSAADAAAGRTLVLEVARLADVGVDPKVLHAKAAMAKLFVTEAAYRCADRAVQAFGGRGYLRTNVAERFLRELRVDRIWEGTSEIQRLIIARGLERRGVERMLH